MSCGTTKTTRLTRWATNVSAIQRFSPLTLTYFEPANISIVSSSSYLVVGIGRFISRGDPHLEGALIKTARHPLTSEARGRPGLRSGASRLWRE